MLQLLELVQALGVWGGRGGDLKLAALCPCLHSITPLQPCILGTHKGAVTSHLSFPQPSTIPAEGSPCTSSQDTSLLCTHTAKPLRTLALGQGPKRGELQSLQRLFASADPCTPHCCRAQGHIARRSQETGCLHLHLMPCKVSTGCSGLTALTQ